MRLSRRRLLKGALCGAFVGAAGCGPGPRPRVGGLLGAGRASQAHRLWAPFQAQAGVRVERARVVIVGGGVAGLSAAWRLRRAGFEGEVLLLELDARLGGTSQSGEGGSGPVALGAHYATIPNQENIHVQAIFADLGLIVGADSAGRPAYDPAAICLAPQERLFIGGEWILGLRPATGATAEDEAQREAWEAEISVWRSTIGADGRPAFALPIALSSEDPALRALAVPSFAEWLDARGYTSPRLRWMIEYGCRDDFGATLRSTSAWAGLHYHCARRPWVADPLDMGTQILTWPGGNGALVDGLAKRCGAKLRVGALVRRVEADTGRVWVEAGGEVIEVQAERVILAVPSAVSARLLDRPAPLALTAAPWRVAVLQLDGWTPGPGVPAAWDSVPWDPEISAEETDLGAIDNGWQARRYGGPTTLSHYQPLCADDPSAARQALLHAGWEEQAEAVLHRMRKGWPDLPEHLARIDIWAWGHGTVRPSPGLHTDPRRLAALGAVEGRVHHAHTELSGMSLFEEASWHGVRAAEEVLVALGAPVGPSLLGADLGAAWRRG